MSIPPNSPSCKSRIMPMVEEIIQPGSNPQVREANAQPPYQHLEEADMSMQEQVRNIQERLLKISEPKRKRKYSHPAESTDTPFKKVKIIDLAKIKKFADDYGKKNQPIVLEPINEGSEQVLVNEPACTKSDGVELEEPKVRFNDKVEKYEREIFLIEKKLEKVCDQVETEEVKEALKERINGLIEMVLSWIHDLQNCHTTHCDKKIAEDKKSHDDVI